MGLAEQAGGGLDKGLPAAAGLVETVARGSMEDANECAGVESTHARRPISVQVLGGAVAAECQGQVGVISRNWRSRTRRSGSAQPLRRASEPGRQRNGHADITALTLSNPSREHGTVETFRAARWLGGISEISGAAGCDGYGSGLRPIDHVA